MTCHDWAGARAVPDDMFGGYAPFPCCVIEATETFVCFENDEDVEAET